MVALPAGRFAAILLALVFGGPAAAQTVCQLGTAPGQADRRVLQCGDAIRVEGQPGTRFRPVNQDADPFPEAVVVNEGRVLTRVHGRNPIAPVGVQPAEPFEFQIRTPHAIASVRGTVWAVGVEDGRTSIYVKDGEVRVERVLDGSAAIMACNDGVDIAADAQGPLEVRQWSGDHADTFLEPFGVRGGCPPGTGPQQRGDGQGGAPNPPEQDPAPGQRHDRSPM